MLWLLLFIVVAVLVWLIAIYNRLQGMMQSIREQHSNLLAALKKRLDLANQIVDIASGYGEHEKVVQISVNKPNETMQNMLALGQAYPQLRANETYQTLMTQLESLEQSILERRERYNAHVRDYNSYRNAFPQILVASKLSFEAVSYFELDDAEFEQSAKVFQRDDTAALKELLTSGSKTVGDLKNSAVQSVKKGIHSVQKSDTDTVNPEMDQTDIKNPD